MDEQEFTEQLQRVLQGEEWPEDDFEVRHLGESGWMTSSKGLEVRTESGQVFLVTVQEVQR